MAAGIEHAWATRFACRESVFHDRTKRAVRIVSSEVERGERVVLRLAFSSVSVAEKEVLADNFCDSIKFTKDVFDILSLFVFGRAVTSSSLLFDMLRQKHFLFFTRCPASLGAGNIDICGREFVSKFKGSMETWFKQLGNKMRNYFG